MGSGAAGRTAAASATTTYATIGFSPGSPGDLPLTPQPPALFQDLRQVLGIRNLRIFVPVDNPAAAESYVDQAIGSGYDVLVQLTDGCVDTCTPPSLASYSSAVQAVVSALPGVHEWSAWDEPDVPHGGAGIVPAPLAASEYAATRYVLNHASGHATDTLVAGEFLLAKKRYDSTYLTALERDLSAEGYGMPTVWSFHPYVDLETHPDFSDSASPSTQTGNFSGTVTRNFVAWLDRSYRDASLPEPQVWLTESGTQLGPECGANIACPLSGQAIAQEEAAYEFLALPNISRGQITREYYYNWQAGTPLSTGDFDSALLDRNGAPRPAACVLLGLDQADIATYCTGDSAYVPYGSIPPSTGPASPENASTPTLSTDDPMVGQAVAATTGAWLGNVATDTYTWADCPPTGACTPIAGADAASYIPTDSDVGDRLAVTVTAGNPWGSSPDSAATTAVTAVRWTYNPGMDVLTWYDDGANGPNVGLGSVGPAAASSGS